MEKVSLLVWRCQVIESCLTVHGRLAFLRGDVRPDHVFRIALYTDKAELTYATKSYTAVGEVKGQGYSSKTLAQPTYKIEDKLALVSFPGDVVWPNSTISAAGYMIYDETLDNLAIAVGSFGATISSTNDKFTLNPPDGLVVFK